MQNKVHIIRISIIYFDALHVILLFKLKKKKKKKHSENADTSTSATFELSCDLDHKSRSKRLMSLDVTYCILP